MGLARKHITNVYTQREKAPEIVQQVQIHFEVSKCEECFMVAEDPPEMMCRFYDHEICFFGGKPPFCRINSIIVEMNG